MDAWKFLLEFHRISDQDIKEILNTDEQGNRRRPIHTESSDDARRAILKIYSYESPLYKAVNRANMCQDRSAIKTLGPFSYLLYRTLDEPPVENEKVQEENTTHKGDYGQRITLYRGLGLPE